jgi:hypothetical protein
MPWFRITEESERKGMAAFEEWAKATLRVNPQLKGLNVDAFLDYADRGFEAAWKFRDMVEAVGFDAAIASLQAEGLPGQKEVS